MAEVKNSFIKSKMNKDLDARLLPNGEYREGNNIQVSKSEGADVGALENVLGNLELVDFKVQSGCNCNLTAIGMFTDNLSDYVYVFLTDYDEKQNADYIPQALNYSPTANNYVYRYDVANPNATAEMLLSGAYLNFSINNPIYAVNLLENILFWTDNRNQPRKIDILKAAGGTAQATNGFYTTEDQISVATYAPYQPIELYYKRTSEYNTNGGQGTTESVSAGTTPTWTVSLDAATLVGISPTDLVGATVSWAGQAVGTFVIASYGGNVLTITGTPDPSLTAGVVLTFNANTLVGNNQYVTSMLDVSSQTNPDGSANANYDANYNGDPDFLEDKFVRFSYRFKYIDNTYSIMAPFTQAAFIPRQDGYFLGTSNPFLDNNSKDEQNAYRSTVVDFMENKVNNILLQIPTPTLDSNGIPSSNGIVGTDLYNKLNIQEIEILYKESDGVAVKVVDSIPRSTVGESTGYEQLSIVNGVSTDIISYNYQGTKPFKTLPEAEIVRVFDKVPVKALGQEIIGNRVVYSNFQNKHTPPPSLDYNVGISNKNTNFAVNDSSNPTLLKPLEKTVSREYPMHTVKQNRNYQVGVVLSDKYGRSSTVLLSTATTQATDTINLVDVKLVGDTVYFPYNVVDLGVNNDINSWPGDSIKVLFRNPINSTADSGSFTPGIYNGDSTSSDYNPLGWYSYKIVVKQQEQEYYNVYLPGILNPYPKDISVTEDPTNTINTIVLLNDNINKVPRDLTEVGPEQQQFRSAVELYGRVTPQAAALPLYNQQYNPSTASNVIPTISTVASIGKQNDLFDNTTNVVFSEIYQSISNPEIARLSQDEALPIGSLPVGTQGAAYNLLLGVYETKPFESLLDIYYETSSSGTVAQLNEAIDSSSVGAAGFTTSTDGGSAPDTWTFNLYENITSSQSPNQTFNGSYTTLTNLTPGVTDVPDKPFWPYTKKAGGSKTIINQSLVDGAITFSEYASFTGTQQGFSVTRADGVDVSDQFTLIKDESVQPYRYWIVVRSGVNFYYGPNSSTQDSFTFSFNVTNLDVAVEDRIKTVVTQTGKLKNIKPTFTNCPTSDLTPSATDINLITFTAVSGALVNTQSGLSFHITNQTPAANIDEGIPLIEIDSTTGILSNNSGLFPSGISVTVQVRDGGYNVANTETFGGQAFDNCVVNINAGAGFTAELLNENFGNYKNLLINAGAESSTFIWSTSADIVNAYNAPPLLQTASATIPVNPSVTFTDNTASTLAAQGLTRVETTASNCTDWYWWNTVRANTLTYGNAIGLSNFGGQTSSTSFQPETGGGTTSNSGLDSLTQGTAYIMVDYFLRDYGGTSTDQPSVIWPTYLQYRAPGETDFVQAIDIEGRPIQFGGTQDNDNTIQTQDTQYASTGIIFDKDEAQKGTSSSSTNTEQAWVKDSFQSRYDGSGSGFFNSRGRKIFAVGKNQAYRLGGGAENPDAQDKFGEYRLIVRYPYGDNTGTVIPTLSTTNCPSGIYSSNLDARNNQQVYLNYGDFYKPTLLLNKYQTNGIIEGGGLTDNVVSYRYYISEGFETKEQAEAQVSFNQVVFAKEWSMRYVSHFYTDANLTNVYLPHTGSTLWHSYISYSQPPQTAAQSVSQIFANRYWGNENSSPNAPGILPGVNLPDPQNAIVGKSNKTIDERKWVAQFDAGGKKVPYYASIAGGEEPAYPCELKGATPAALPTGGVQYGKALVSDWGNPPETDESATANNIAVWFNGSDAITNAQLFMTALLPGGGNNAYNQPAQFIKSSITNVEVFDGAYPHASLFTFTCTPNVSKARLQNFENVAYRVIFSSIEINTGTQNQNSKSNFYWKGL